MKHIMVATDFSERSDRALRRATLLARQSGASITLLTAVDEDRPRRLVEEEKREAEVLLREMSATVRSVDGVPCEARVVLAEPSQAIVQAASEAGPDLLVIGPHRRQLFRDIFVGTTAERTIRNAPCPVLMVNATPAGAYRHVLLTTDLSDGSWDAVTSYSKLQLADRLPHSMLYVFDAPMLRLAMTSDLTEREKRLYIEDEWRKASIALSNFITSIQLEQVDSLLRYQETTANDEILAAAAEIPADLVVLATHGRRGLEKLLLGSVTEKVLRDSDVDVLAVPPQRSS
ncbi:MAG: universal stress protein [Hydrogenophaga sp.]|nr:universal stress protein [Hydrogenophaga sp.]